MIRSRDDNYWACFSRAGLSVQRPQATPLVCSRMQCADESRCVYVLCVFLLLHRSAAGNRGCRHCFKSSRTLCESIRNLHHCLKDGRSRHKGNAVHCILLLPIPTHKCGQTRLSSERVYTYRGCSVHVKCRRCLCDCGPCSAQYRARTWPM